MSRPLGPLFCRACGSSELTNAEPPRCAHCGLRVILTVGSLRAIIAGYHQGRRKDALLEATKRLLREAGASWPERAYLARDIRQPASKVP